jgi:flagellar protein FliO/FliZ
VRLISALEDQETVDAMLLDESRRAPEAGSRFGDFKALLRRLGGGAGSAPGFSADTLRRQREKLKGL